MKVTVDGQDFTPVDMEEAAALGERIANFHLEGTSFWRERFIEWDTAPGGGRYGMYSDDTFGEGKGDEFAPFFSEAFLYNLVGKDEARSILGIIRDLSRLAGVKHR